MPKTSKDQKAADDAANGSEKRKRGTTQAARGTMKPKAAERDPGLVLLGAYVPQKLQGDLIGLLGILSARTRKRVFMSELIRMGVAEVAAYKVSDLSACLEKRITKRAAKRESGQVYVGGYIAETARDALLELIGRLAVQERKRVSVSELIRIGLEDIAQKFRARRPVTQPAYPPLHPH